LTGTYGGEERVQKTGLTSIVLSNEDRELIKFNINGAKEAEVSYSNLFDEYPATRCLIR